MINVQSIKLYLLDKKLQAIKKRNDKRELENYLINCKRPTDAIDRLSAFDLRELSIEVYSRKVDGYYNLYDYILRTKKTSILAKQEDTNNPNIYLPWIEYSKDFNYLTLTDEILLDTLPSGKKIIDFAIETGKINNSSRQPIEIKTIELAKILYEKKLFKCLSFCDFNLYNQELTEGKTVFDILMENKVVPNILGIECYTRNSSVNKCLLEEINGKSILEHLIDNNLKFKLNLFDSFFEPEELEKIKDILAKKNRFDLIECASSKFLKTKIKHDGKEESIIHHYVTSYFGSFNVMYDFDIDVECIEECLKAWSDIKSTDGINNGLDTIDKHYNYGLSARGELQSLIYRIPKETYREKTSSGISVLELLLQYCNDPVKKIESSCVEVIFDDIVKKFEVCPQEFAILFVKYGLITENDYVKEIGIKKDEISDYIYPKENIDINDEEILSLINDFYDIYDDGKSSKRVLDLVIYSFKKSYQINRDIAIRDLNVFIEMKKKYPKFYFIYDEIKGSKFSPPSLYKDESYLSLNNLNDIYVLNHECGHLIHFFCESSNVPQETRNLLYRQQNIEEDSSKRDAVFKRTISLGEELMKRNDDLYEQEFHKFIISKKGSMDSYIEEIKKEFQQFFGTDKILLESINDIIKTDVYYPQLLNALADAYYDMDSKINKEELIDLYVKNRIETEKKYFKDTLYQRDNSIFLLYENFIDAYYQGALGSYLKYKKIKVPSCCHDTMYFLKGFNKSFEEMIADYIALTKSKDGQEYIELLKQETSPELIDSLENYYKNMSCEQSLNRHI